VRSNVDTRDSPEGNVRPNHPYMESSRKERETP
jgi:hypothetical protein